MCRQPAFGVFIANVCIRSFRSRISGRWSSPTFGTASCSACCGHGGTDVFFQTASLFLLGMLIGRRQLFANLSEHRVFWMRTLVIGAVCFVPLYFITASLPDMISNKAMLTPMNTVVSSFRNFSFMCVLVACFVFLWQQVSTHEMLHGLVPYGKMSLTNYLTQSIIGSFIYFGYGLSLYNVLGTTASFGVGVLLFILQLGFCHWWLKKFKQGPIRGGVEKGNLGILN